MIYLLLLSSFSKQIILKLQNCILYHNLKYIAIFNNTLKPKYFLIYYCNVIKMSSRLKFLWSYKFEYKHREFIIYIKNITS